MSAGVWVLVVTAALLAPVVVVAWPWTITGKRKHIKIKTRRKDWE